VLRGDEIGWLLASALLPLAKPGDVVATSIVSSTMLAKMAAAANVAYADTLTGFKWVAKAAGSGRLLFGYEEAIGYGVDDAVGDKDGLSAALAVAKLAFDLAVEGQTLFDRLDELETRFGVHAGAQVSLRVTPPAGREVLIATMARVRREPPASLGGLELTEVIDLEAGWRGLPATEGLIWRLGAASRVIVRPSGTEPKLKAYIEVVAAPDEDVAAARQRAYTIVEALSGDLRTTLAL
jgi:phosphomannomutase